LMKPPPVSDAKPGGGAVRTRTLNVAMSYLRLQVGVVCAACGAGVKAGVVPASCQR
jgi:hypothetical protein